MSSLPPSAPGVVRTKTIDLPSGEKAASWLSPLLVSALSLTHAAPTE